MSLAHLRFPSGIAPPTHRFVRLHMTQYEETEIIGLQAEMIERGMPLPAAPPSERASYEAIAQHMLHTGALTDLYVDRAGHRVPVASLASHYRE
jgi:hypothetical protein